MRMSWRGPRFLTVLIVLAGSASATTAAARLNVSPTAEAAVLARSLQSKNATEAAASAYWLGLKGPEAVPTIPHLIAALADDRRVNPGVYRSNVKAGVRTSPGEEAAEALARIGQPAIDPLIKALRASASAVARRNAALALGQINARDATTNAARPRPGSTPPEI